MPASRTSAVGAARLLTVFAVRVFAVVVLAVVLPACGSDDGAADRPRARATTSSTHTAIRPTSPSTTVPTPPPSVPAPSPPTPPPAPPPYIGTAAAVTEADLPHTYRAGCPVAPEQLRMLDLSYWGFDGAPHPGRMVVSAAVADQVVEVFRRLYDERFPIRSMRPVDDFGGSDPDSMAVDNTSGFNCRNAVADGPPHWSVHAYGEAIDVNPVENPYLQGGRVQPVEGAAYVDRSVVRDGMATPDSVLNQAFAAVGWQWGGTWATPDYQHFSATGG